MMCPSPSSLLLGLLAILFPPVAVWAKRGLCTPDSLINLALCMLGYLPGLLHAWYIIAVTPDDYDPYGYEVVQDVEAGRGEQGFGPQGQPGARTTHYYVSAPNQQFHGQGATVPAQRLDQGYGTLTAPSAQPAGPSAGGVGNDAEVPPTYTEAIKGDHKVQRA